MDVPTKPSPFERYPPPVSLERQEAARSDPSQVIGAQNRAMFVSHFIKSAELHSDWEKVDPGSFHEGLNRTLVDCFDSANAVREAAGICRQQRYGVDVHHTLVLDVPEEEVQRFSRELRTHKSADAFCVAPLIQAKMIDFLLCPNEVERGKQSPDGTFVPCYKVWPLEGHLELAVQRESRNAKHFQRHCIKNQSERRCSFNVDAPITEDNVPCQVMKTALQEQEEQIAKGDDLLQRQWHYETVGRQQKKQFFRGHGRGNTRGKVRGRGDARGSGPNYKE